jgi:pyrroline-5-carboxylate reductase
MTRVGVIGFGKMAQAIFLPFLETASEHLPLSVVDLNEQVLSLFSQDERLQFMSLEDCVSQSDILFIAIKPQQSTALLQTLSDMDFSGKTLVSIMAGITCDQIAHFFEGGASVIRLMPNTPILVKEGITAIYSGACREPNHLELVKDVFKDQFIELEEESLMHPVTALSGSGPAFFYKIAQTMVTDGVSQGLSQDLAEQLVYQTMRGASKMLLKTGKDSQTLIDDVTSPNGTTAAGLAAFEDQSLHLGLTAMVQAAVKRSKELSQLNEE